jgi:hypothetical protein
LENNQPFDFITDADGLMWMKPSVSTYTAVDNPCVSDPLDIDFNLAVSGEVSLLWENDLYNKIAVILNPVKLILKNTLNVSLRLKTTVVFEPTDNKFNNCTNLHQTLKHMAGYSQNNLERTGFWMLLTHCEHCSGCVYTAGMAYVGGVCTNNMNVGLANINTENQQTTWSTLVHEIGHLLGGQHPFKMVFDTLNTDKQTGACVKQNTTLIFAQCISEAEWNTGKPAILWETNPPSFDKIDTDNNGLLSRAEVESFNDGLVGAFGTIMDYKMDSTDVDEYLFGNVNNHNICTLLSERKESCPYISPGKDLTCNSTCSNDQICTNQTCQNTTSTTPTSSSTSVLTSTTTTTQPTTAPSVLGTRWFTSRDKNNDNKVTYDESGLSRSRFNALNTNNDAYLTISEIIVPPTNKPPIPQWAIITGISVGGVMFIVVVACICKKCCKPRPATYATVPVF